MLNGSYESRPGRRMFELLALCSCLFLVKVVCAPTRRVLYRVFGFLFREFRAIPPCALSKFKNSLTLTLVDHVGLC
jgi:hypothetical protein